MRVHNVAYVALFARRLTYNQGFWIYLYFRIRHSFAHLRPGILSADWSFSRLQSWTCSSLSTVAEFVKLTQSIVIEIQRQSADLYKVQLCNRQFFVVSTAVYVVKVYECHPLGITITQSHKHTMQQTRTHKAVTRRVEAKKLLSLVEGNRSIVTF